MPAWSLRPVDRRRRTGRGVRAAVASLVLPGAGQLLVGKRRRGLVLLTLSVLGLVGALAFVWTQPTAELVGWLLRPSVLVGLLAVNLVLLAFRLFATFDAYVQGVRPPAEPPLPRTAWRATGVVLALGMLAVVTLLPHVVVGYYAAAAHGVVSTVFVEAAAGPVPPVDVADGDRADGTEEAVDPTPIEPAGEGPSEAGPDPQPRDDVAEEPPPPPENPWLAAGRITVALLGSDAGPGRGGDRIDSFLVLTVDPSTGDAAILSVDRYLADFPLPTDLAPVYDEHCLEGEGWRYLNALYRCGAERAPEEFAALYPRADDPAAAAVADVLGRILGIAVPHHAMVDMGGFVEVVDALGGVEVELAEPLRVRMSPAQAGESAYVVDLDAGVQELDGREALAFVRFRDREGGDADRMRRQRCLVSSVAERADVTALLLGFPALAGAVEAHVVTSIPLARLPDLVAVLPLIDPDRVVTAGFGPPEYRGWDHVPDVDAIQARVRDILSDPDAALADGAATEAADAVCR